MSNDGMWFRKREHPPRRTGPSTVDGKTADELSEVLTEAIRTMRPEELEAFADQMVEEAGAASAERTEAAAARRAQRYWMN